MNEATGMQMSLAMSDSEVKNRINYSVLITFSFNCISKLCSLIL
jgi:hypothetical protein